MDELGYLSQIYEKKLDFLLRLQKDCKQLESDEIQAGRAPNNPGGVSMEERVIFAIQLVKEVHERCDSFMKELNESMNAVFLPLT